MIRKKLVEVNDYQKEYVVPYGTEYGDLRLPQNLRFTDNTGKETPDFSVVWVSKPPYDGTIAGTYEFTADIDSDSGIRDYDIACEIPNIRVTVKEEGKTPQAAPQTENLKHATPTAVSIAISDPDLSKSSWNLSDRWVTLPAMLNPRDQQEGKLLENVDIIWEGICPPFFI